MIDWPAGWLLEGEMHRQGAKPTLRIKQQTRTTQTTLEKSTYSPVGNVAAAIANNRRLARTDHTPHIKPQTQTTKNKNNKPPFIAGGHSVAAAFAKYEHLARSGAAIPAIGYSRQQLEDLRESIANVKCDTSRLNVAQNY